MGWLWPSSSNGNRNKSETATDGTEAAKKLDWGLSDQQKQRIFGRSSTSQDADRSHEAQTDKDLEEFLNSLSTSDPTKTSPTPNQLPKPQPQENTNHDRILPDGSLNISPAAVYPRTMSCRQAFDQAFYCQSLGGKFNDIYRYGALQSCSEQWGAFWFCMRTKSLPKNDKEKAIMEHYAAREERKTKEFGNSEGVWEIREKAVERAFHKDPDADEVL